MNERIVGYDIARGLAVFGMVAVNYKIAMGASENGPAWLAALSGMLEGRAAALFVTLAGVGISLLSRQGRTLNDRVRLARDRRTLLRRACFLFIAGALYTSIYSADILHFYGVYILIAAFLLTASTRRLWFYGGLLTAAFAGLCLVLDYEQGWDWKTLEYDGLWTLRGTFRHLFFNGFHPVAPWLAFLLAGMAVGRQDMGEPAVRRRVFVWGAGIALAAEGMSRLLVKMLSRGAPADDAEALAAIFGTEAMPPMPLYVLAAGGAACAVIAASVALGERYASAAWARPLAAAGQLALTLYVAHVLVGLGILDALGRLENQSLPFALSAALAFCAAGAAFASLWRGRFRRGPLEAVMRALTDRPATAIRARDGSRRSA